MKKKKKSSKRLKKKISKRKAVKSAKKKSKKKVLKKTKKKIKAKKAALKKKKAKAKVKKAKAKRKAAPKKAKVKKAAPPRKITSALAPVTTTSVSKTPQGLKTVGQTQRPLPGGFEVERTEVVEGADRFELNRQKYSYQQKEMNFEGESPFSEETETPEEEVLIEELDEEDLPPGLKD